MKWTLVILPLLFLTILSPGQDAEKHAVFTGEVRETLILNTDREVYIAGEKAWFTATRLINGTLPDVDFSRVLYAELCGLDKNLHVLTKQEINGNLASGVVDIPEDLPTGYYVLRAYTAFQRNGGPEAFASKVVSIINPLIPPPQSSAGQDTLPEIFPMTADDNGAYRYGMFLSPDLARSKAVKVEMAGQLIPVRHFPNGLAYFSMDSLTVANARIYIINRKDTVTYDVKLPPWPPLALNLAQKGEVLEASVASESGATPLRGEYRLSVCDALLHTIHTEYVKAENWNRARHISLAGVSPRLIFVFLENEAGDTLSRQAFYPGKSPMGTVHVSTGQKTYGSRERVTAEVDLGADHTALVHYDVAVVKDGLGNDEAYLPAYLVRNPYLLEGFMSTFPMGTG